LKDKDEISFEYLSNSSLWLETDRVKHHLASSLLILTVPNLCPELTALYGFLWYHKVLYGSKKNPETFA
jgi:hypothetical protein